MIATLAFAYSTWAIWGAGEEVIAKGFMLLLAGIPVYIWLKWRQSRVAPPVWELTVQRPPQATERTPVGTR